MLTFSVLSFNTGLCRIFGVDLGRDHEQRAFIIRDELKRLAPDIVCFQEVWDHGLLEVVRAGLPDHAIVNAPRGPWWAPMGSGLVIATRCAVRAQTFRAFCPTWRPKEILARRGLLTAVLDTPAGPLAVTSTHLGMGLPPLRRRQHRAMLRRLEEIEPPHIVCGDFNVTPDEMTRYRFPTRARFTEKGLIDTMAEALGQPEADRKYTVDWRNPRVKWLGDRRIDYVWAHAGSEHRITVESADLAMHVPVNELYPSDHFAVLARLRLEPGKTEPRRLG